MKSLVASTLLFLCASSTSILAQKDHHIRILDSGRDISIRGLSVVDEQTLWCSGSKGTVARSIDGGQHFEWMTVQGYEKRDFRDIEAFDKNNALIMGIDAPALILKTKDGGLSWQKVFEDSTKGMFLDAMVFDAKGSGSVVGDPIEGQLFQAYSTDFGDTWLQSKQTLELAQGEAFFASSGTNIQSTGDKDFPYLWVSGGLQSRLFYKGHHYPLPLQKGKTSTGANSIARYGKQAFIVGGDFAQDKSSDSNSLWVQLGKELQFTPPNKPPLGYKSCVIYCSKHILIACGTSGVDISYDGGQNWQNISKESYHVVQKAKRGNAVFLAGSKGKIAKMNIKQEQSWGR
jgi:hypothetical protein